MRIGQTLLLLLLIVTAATGQNIPTDRIDSVFAEWNFPESPGCALGIIENGQLVYSKGYGSADLEHDIAITPSTVFYIGSVSKQFVTFCILLLEEEGKLDLDDKIQVYLPDFPEYQSPLTIRHFVHHTSGVRDYLTLMNLKGRSYLDHIDDEEVYELIKRQQELNFDPGEKYLYSNACYFMLAMIVERASGQTIREYAEENIFGPLKMTDSRFHDDVTQLIKNRAFSYFPIEGQAGFENVISRFDLVGSGGVYSTVEDLFKWDQNFYNNMLGKGGQAIIDKMHEDGVLNNGESAGYAFAVTNGEYKGLRTVSHGGALAGYRSYLLRFPDENFSVVILANRSDANPGAKCYSVADILLKDRFQPEPETEEFSREPVNDGKVTPAQAAAFAGLYNLRPNVSVEVSTLNDSLMIRQLWNYFESTVYAVSDNTFISSKESNTNFTFGDEKNDLATTLTVKQGSQTFVFKRKEETEQFTVNLEDYPGNYYSPELEVSYRFAIVDSTLQLTLPGGDPKNLTFTSSDVCEAPPGLQVHFQRESDNVTGFLLDAGRVQNLKFNKSE